MSCTLAKPAHIFSFKNCIALHHRGPTQSVWVADCYFIVNVLDLPSSNQKGAISKTVCGWHVRISLRITVAPKLLDFDFLRGLAPGRLDGFSIERYEKNRGSFDLYAAKFESGAMRFWGEKSPRRWNPFKTSFHPCLSVIKNSQRRTEIHSKSLKKPLLRQKDDYTPQVR